MCKSLITLFLLLAVPVFGQAPGDLNCNNICFEIADVVVAVQTLMSSCSLDSMPECLIENSDVDEDSISLTMGDYLFMYNFVSGFPNRNFPRNPLADTLRVASSEAYPGQTLSLPVDLVTADTLSAFEFYLVTDPQYLTIDTLLAEPGLEINEQLCQGSLFVFACSLFYLGDPILLMPGTHHLGDIVVSVASEIYDPVTTPITFSSDPGYVCHTGLANISFFTPVLVNSVIEITPTDVSQDANTLPDEVSIGAFPNPFNSSVTLFVNGMDRAEIGVFDIAGRRIALLHAQDGKAVWDASGYSSGVYFARIVGVAEVSNSLKLVYMK